MAVEARPVRLDPLEKIVKKILSPAGPDGALAAAALIEAEVLGYPEFGLRLLQEIGQGARLERGQIIADSSALTVIDAAGCFGPVAVAGAAYRALGIAHMTGLGLVGLRGVGAVGRLAPYVEAIAEMGCFALLLAHSPPLVAPAGGRAPVLGTNPIAYAAPSPAGPVVADFAASAITKAKLVQARAAGTPLPIGSALDSKGLPTTDPNLAQALTGFGGAKSSLVALLVELFAGALLAARGNPLRRGLLLVALKPEALSSPEASVQVETLAEAIRAAGGHVPGDGASTRRHEVRRRGVIEVEPAVIELLASLNSEIVDLANLTFA